MKRLFPYFDAWLIVTAALIVLLAAGCSSDSSSNPPIDGDQEVVSEQEADNAPATTKCKSGEHQPELQVGKVGGGHVQYCVVGEDLDGAGMDIKNDDVVVDINLAVQAADDLVVEGWTPIGPAVIFKATPVTAGEVPSLRRDVVVTLPFSVADLPENAMDYHINVLIQLDPENGTTNGESNAPFFTPKNLARVKIDRDNETVSIKEIHFGTYQVVARSEIQETSERAFTYRAMAGISMGSAGAALVGFNNPEWFDIIAPMGGWMGFDQFVKNVHDLYLGGFCTFDEITKKYDENGEMVMDGDQPVWKTLAELDAFVMDESAKCGWRGFQTNPDYWYRPKGIPRTGDTETPPGRWYLARPSDFFYQEEAAMSAPAEHLADCQSIVVNEEGLSDEEKAELQEELINRCIYVIYNDLHAMGYNNWYFDDQGGNFNREEYVKLFQDLSFSFGNPTNYSPDSMYLAPGALNPDLKYLEDIYKDGKDREEACLPWVYPDSIGTCKHDTDCTFGENLDLLCMYQGAPISEASFYTNGTPESEWPSGECRVVCKKNQVCTDNFGEFGICVVPEDGDKYGIPADEHAYFTDGTPEDQWLEGYCQVKMLAGRMRSRSLDTNYRSMALQNFYDREYNPDGEFPVILFCDGSNRFTDSDGVNWTDRRGEFKMEDSGHLANRLDIGLAVDFNRNGMRDIGEPVLRQTWEPFEDCGSDGLCPGEAGDTTDDDYNPKTNALGTEGNGLWDEGEAFEDVGLDGVAGTPQASEAGGSPLDENGPWDYGEGNGKFDNNPNIQNWFDNCARQHAMKMGLDDLKRLNVWMDAGIRDIASFVTMGDSLIGTLDARLSVEGMHAKSYDSVMGMLKPESDDIGDFDFLKVDYGKLGHDVLLRYGRYWAPWKEIKSGDGRHLGMPNQTIFRVQALFGFADAHFPKGDYEVLNMDMDPNNLLQQYTYYSEVLGRLANFSIALPPGYYSNADVGYEANAENGMDTDGSPKPHTCIDTKRFPVILLAHGYGQEPEDNAVAIPILFGLMKEGIMQKMITLFPDGKCDSADRCQSDCREEYQLESEREQCYEDRKCSERKAECMKGNFYSNNVASRAQSGGRLDFGWRPAGQADVPARKRGPGVDRARGRHFLHAPNPKR